MLIETAGAHDEVVKLLPPLILDAEGLDKGMSILRESFAEVAARHGLEVEHLVGRISLRVPEVARTLGVSTRKVEQWVASGELAAWRRGRVVGVALVDLLRFLEESRIQPRGRSVAERAAALLER